MIIQHWAKSVKFAAQRKKGPRPDGGGLLFLFYANAPIGSQGFGPIFTKIVKARKTGIYNAI